MGDLNWWLPKWLDRILPDMDFESSGPPPAAAEADKPPALVVK
jgi:putative drug exporter of the RND superfamily